MVFGSNYKGLDNRGYQRLNRHLYTDLEALLMKLGMSQGTQQNVIVHPVGFLSVVLDGNGLAWRKAIHGELIKASADSDIREKDRIELEVTLYLCASAVHWHDGDNGLKDIMEVLQGGSIGMGRSYLDTQLFQTTAKPTG